MATIDEIREARLKKLKRLKENSISPYPIKAERLSEIKDVLDNFEELSSSKKPVTLVGRIKSIRSHGGSAFFDIEDYSSKIQVFLKKDAIGDKRYYFFEELMDIGDFVGVKGFLFQTKKGEKTLEANDFTILSKSLRPLPEKWHGLKDTEERYRKRYLDLIFNKEVKEKFELRSKIVSELRKFMEEKGFLEVETPILQPIYGGAKARPFKTHLNAMDMDLYLRIAPELYLKRLIIGGFEKVYEIGRSFRNEGVDKSHNPDFTSLEFYYAYKDYEDLMKFTEEMISSLVKTLFKSTKINLEGKEIDLKPPFQRIDFSNLIKKYAGIDLNKLEGKELYEKAKLLGVSVSDKMGDSEVIDEVYKKYCKPKVLEPTFIVNHPLGFFPLAKAMDNNKSLANFQLVIGGWEMANAFSELNDPIEQRKRFEEQEKFFKKGLEEAQRMDEDFIEALEYGMPPCAGFGMGIDRLVALLTNSHSLRETILFPLMKEKK